MTILNELIFKKEHKRFYTNQDIYILDEYRSVTPTGTFCECLCDDLVEVDITKAFSAAFSYITKIPIFNTFDIFKSYDNQLIKPLNLYIVFAKNPNLFMNKQFNLIYGTFLEQVKEDVEILYYKEPSFIKTVNYSEILKTLYDTHISDNKTEDIYLKKLIANVNIGLLEKGTNRDQKTFIFDSLEEAQHYQAQYGGNLSILRKEQGIT